MKKFILSLVTIALLLTTSGCGTLGSGLTSGTTGTTTTNTGGSILGGILNSNTTGGLLDLVIGGIKLDQQSLVGTWRYSAPGVAFTSENLLAKAGGAVAAAQIKSKLQSTYAGVGVNSSNTYFAFDNANKFQASIAGIPLSGTYTFDPSSGAIQFNATLLKFNGYVTRTTNGISITYESQKLLTVLQAATKLTGNSTLSTVGELSKNFNGVRMGFDLVQ